MGFIEDLQSLLNRYSMENGSDTPDFLLAEYLSRCIDNWNLTVTAREKYYGRIIPDNKDRVSNSCEISTPLSNFIESDHYYGPKYCHQFGVDCSTSCPPSRQFERIR